MGLLERGFAYNVLLFCSSNQAQRSDNVHDVSRKDFVRLLGGLRRISTRKTNAEPRCLTSLDGHDGAIFAAKHLELVHAHHLANPYTDLTNSIWGTKY